MKAVAALFVLAASSSTTPRPGLWEIVATPTGATLDGRPLTDLPYTQPSVPERRCVAAAALTPDALIERESPDGCTVTRRTPRRGGLAVGGVCAPRDGQVAGSFAMDGSWSADRYRVTFQTRNPAENGVMGFSGRIDARRVGDCVP